MISVFEYCSSKSGKGHTLKLKEDDVVVGDATCIGCRKSTIGSPTYICIVSHDDLDCQNVYLHKSCAELYTHIDYHLDPLRVLKQEEEQDDIIGEDATCHVCNTPIVAGPPTYTCIRDDNIVCQSFYLHRSCAELPLQLNHHKHNKHPLALLSRPSCSCDVCGREPLKVAYACADCDFDVCVFCAFEQRVLHHQGHEEHTLTLMPREALFNCDACYEEAKDSSYVCTTCDFWIHKSCALSPSTVQAPIFHHHPLNLMYSIPNLHRFFERYCNICKKLVFINCWVYYCHKCTYFAHMKCATSVVSIVNDTEADAIDNEADLVQLPLPSKESLFDLIITQSAKFQVNFQGEGENNTTVSTITDDPHIIKGHWSHPDHPLEQLHFSISENDNDDDIVGPTELICNGCIQPITLSHPSYYACIQCGFFLHSFCATKLSLKLPVGASPFHPEHSLDLWKRNTAFSLVTCRACNCYTNGFFYHCKTCDIIVDIRCAFLPTRIKHVSHRHSLVQRPFSDSLCSASRISITGGLEYGCETCSNFRINVGCAFLPRMIKHRYDDHPITLRLPPFFYEGVFYCEICEEQVNNQWALYHCDESDHSFHYACFDLLDSIKFGGTIAINVDNRSHTFTFVLKRPQRKGFIYKCRNCALWYKSGFFLECDGCGYLACYPCVIKVLGESSPEEYVIPA